jgi:hypothetical protein
MPPVFATALRQPELMGLSAGGSFVVTDAPVAPEDVPALLQRLGVSPLSSVSSVVACAAECAPGLYDVHRHRHTHAFLSPFV